MTWLHHLWFAWFWPSIKGNGPEDLTMTAGLALVTAVVYPPARRWVEQELDHLHAKADANMELLQHVIRHHPDIPNDHGVTVPPKGRGRSSG